MTQKKAFAITFLYFRTASILVSHEIVKVNSKYVLIKYSFSMNDKCRMVLELQAIATAQALSWSFFETNSIIQFVPWNNNHKIFRPTSRIT